MSRLIQRKWVGSGVLELSIQREEALNALSIQLLSDLKVELEGISREDAVRVLIMRGAGEKAFVAGADIREMQNMTRSEAARFSRLGHEVCLLLEGMPKVTIAAVHGFALGGGTELALACDFIMASDRAQFGLPEVSLGVIPGFGGTIRLQRVVGAPRAKELLFSGERIKAPEAKDLGLIREVIPQEEFFERVTATALRISKNSMDAIVAAKRLMNEFEESVGIYPKVDAEVHRFSSLFEGADQREGMAAFAEKRAAKFRGMS